MTAWIERVLSSTAYITLYEIRGVLDSKFSIIKAISFKI